MRLNVIAQAFQTSWRSLQRYFLLENQGGKNKINGHKQKYPQTQENHKSIQGKVF